MEGRIHSLQSMGAVDGPGLRYLIFLQGCPMRCVYCHNPDTWDFSAGEEISSDELVRRVLRFRPFFANGGGVTVSGGEALCQGEFVAELFAKLQQNNIHTALDTSGMYLDLSVAERVLNHTDLVLCDIKFATEAAYLAHSGGSLKRVMEFLSLCEKCSVPVWVRHVVTPGLTDTKEEVEAIIKLAKKCATLEKIELLPFKKLCLTKYQSMGIPFPLEEVPECSKELLESLSDLIPTHLR